MRISDWSSDVCSSDLAAQTFRQGGEDCFARVDCNWYEGRRFVRQCAWRRRTDNCSEHDHSRAGKSLMVYPSSFPRRRGSSFPATNCQPRRQLRSDERRVVNEGVSRCSSGGATYHKKKKK